MLFATLLTCVALAAGEVYFKETFDTDPFANNRWVVSKWKQDTGEAGEWEWSPGRWTAYSDRKGIRTTQDARFYAIASKLNKPFDNTNKPLVFQMKVKHEQKIDCGGGYAKLLPSNVDVEKFNGDTPYTIMFGPDICGYSTKKVHSIFNHNGENLLKKSDVKCPDDEYTHTYTLIVNPDDTYEIRVDGEKSETGKLKEGWDFEKPKKFLILKQRNHQIGLMMNIWTIQMTRNHPIGMMNQKKSLMPKQQNLMIGMMKKMENGKLL